MEPPDPNSERTDRKSYNNLAVIGIIVLLLLGSLFLVQKLSALSKLQDCVMSGRRNCAPIEVPAR